MRLDYRRPKEVKDHIGQKVLIKKYSSRYCGDEPGEVLNAIARLTKMDGDTIAVDFEKSTYIKRYDRFYDQFNFWWIECELDPDGNY